MEKKRYPKPLRGSVCAQFRTVGEREYGPYWFRFWREDGRLRKEYVKKSELDQIIEACGIGRQERQRLAERRKEMAKARREAAAARRMANDAFNGFIDDLVRAFMEDK